MPDKGGKGRKEGCEEVRKKGKMELVKERKEETLRNIGAR